MLPWTLEDRSRALTPDKRRLELEERSDCRFVERDEFMRLLVSPKHLIRADERQNGIRGLLDLQSNCRFLIDEEELFRGESVPPQFQY